MSTHRLVRAGIAALATLSVLALPSAAGAATPAPAPAAGSCAAPTGAGAVRYRWTSRTNAWRVRPLFAGLRTTGTPGVGSTNGDLSQSTAHTGVQAWYLVLDARQVGTACYLLVRLPDMGTAGTRSGWVSRDLVQVQRQFWQVEVDLSDRRMRLLRGGRPVVTAQVVIGADGTPTPTTPSGQPFAMYDAKRGAANDFTGSWQLATTALSRVDASHGRIGLHGRGGASLTQALGTAASLGCVRMPNEAINDMVRSVGLAGLLGVPVVIAR